MPQRLPFPRRAVWSRRHRAGLLALVGVFATTVGLLPPTSAHAGGGYVLPSVIRLDLQHHLVTLPLYRGLTTTGDSTWYVVTESSQGRDARARGVNYAPKLANAIGTKAVQSGQWRHGTLVFTGTVDFRPTRVLVPGPTGFPPRQAKPGAVGDPRYSPLVSVGGIVLNASQVANRTGRSDTVHSIDFARHRVTPDLFAGFVGGERNFYLHLDASLPPLAAIEASTYAPNLNAAPGLGRDGYGSARAAIIPIVNGPLGRNNPQRQGLQSALLGQGDPLNVEQEQPTDPTHYSPIWDVTPVVWTRPAIAAGDRHRLVSSNQVVAEFRAGHLVSFGSARPNPSLGGVRAAGFISNCPIIEVNP